MRLVNISNLSKKERKKILKEQNKYVDDTIKNVSSRSQ